MCGFAAHTERDPPPDSGSGYAADSINRSIKSTHCIFTVTGYFRYNLAGLSSKRREVKNKITYFICDKLPTQISTHHMRTIPFIRLY